MSADPFFNDRTTSRVFERAFYAGNPVRLLRTRGGCIKRSASRPHGSSE